MVLLVLLVLLLLVLVLVIAREEPGAEGGRCAGGKKRRSSLGSGAEQCTEPSCTSIVRRAPTNSTSSLTPTAARCRPRLLFGLFEPLPLLLPPPPPPVVVVVVLATS